ncbi:hypothetical protein Rcae01_06763 [Novipirellula caenicola]|uniref:Uncharacterized protein n=1 Tax=Novipirellula caenicola TaxID=1536901 RepID=A0ABP9W1J0_9BACT
MQQAESATADDAICIAAYSYELKFSNPLKYTAIGTGAFTANITATTAIRRGRLNSSWVAQAEQDHFAHRHERSQNRERGT